jgi:hypothetical protein
MKQLHLQFVRLFLAHGGHLDVTQQDMYSGCPGAKLRSRAPYNLLKTARLLHLATAIEFPIPNVS